MHLFCSFAISSRLTGKTSFHADVIMSNACSLTLLLQEEPGSETPRGPLMHTPSLLLDPSPVQQTWEHFEMRASHRRIWRIKYEGRMRILRGRWNWHVINTRWVSHAGQTVLYMAAFSQRSWHSDVSQVAIHLCKGLLQRDCADYFKPSLVSVT